MSKHKRRLFTNQQKAAIVRRHLKDRVPVSDLCDEYEIQPSVLYEWLSKVLAHLDAALDAATPRNATTRLERAHQAKLAALEAKLAKKDQVIAEISEEYVGLKKELGEP